MLKKRKGGEEGSCDGDGKPQQERHNPELESPQCCPYSCCSRHRISPGDPPCFAQAGGVSRVALSLSPCTALTPTPSPAQKPGTLTETRLGFPGAQNPPLEVKNSQGNITRAKWKGHPFLLPLSQCFLDNSLLPHVALGCEASPGGASSSQRPQLPWFCFLPGQGRDQLPPAVRRARGSPSRRDDSSDK